MKKILRFGLVALALLASLSLGGSPLCATKTIVLQNATRSTVQTITLALDLSGQPTEVVSYVVKDAGGNIVKVGTITLTLSAGTRTSLLSHIDSVVLPAIDTAEGL